MIGKAMSNKIPSNEALQQINGLVQLQLKREKQVAKLEEDLATAKLELKKLQEELIPDNMLALGLESFTLSDGTSIEIKKFYAASISDEHKEAAFSWLREHDHDGIIKTDVLSRFGKGDQKEVKFLVSLLKKNKLPFTQKDSVHHATLRAFVKEQLEAGEKIPVDLFGVYVGNKSVIKQAE